MSWLNYSLQIKHYKRKHFPNTGKLYSIGFIWTIEKPSHWVSTGSVYRINLNEFLSVKTNKLESIRNRLWLWILVCLKCSKASKCCMETNWKGEKEKKWRWWMHINIHFDLCFASIRIILKRKFRKESRRKGQRVKDRSRQWESHRDRYGGEGGREWTYLGSFLFYCKWNLTSI